MAKILNLMAFGMGTKLAEEVALGRFEVETGISAAGTDLAGATSLTKVVNVVGTCGSNAGVALNNNLGLMFIENAGANAGKLYPHSSSGTINGGTAGASITFTNAKAYIALRASDTDWRVYQIN